MKKPIYLIGLLVALLGFWSCEDDNDDPVSASKLELNEFTSEALMNNPIGNSELRKMQVYLPKGYDDSSVKKYPVVYLLHSLPFTEEAFITPETWDPWIGGASPFKVYPDFPENGFKVWIDGLIDSGLIDPMIIVMPNAESSYGFSWYSNSELNGGYEDFIVNDLVKYVDSKYKTFANKDGRAVIGVSQGGYGAVKIGLLHADKFGVIASHSGMLYLDGILTWGPLLIAENPDGFVGPHLDKFLTSAMYSMCAAWSPNMTNPPFMVDVPFAFPSGAIIPDVRDRMLKHDVFTMLDTHMDDMKSLNGVFIDCGDQDELGMTGIVDAFCMKMNAMGVEHTYETFNGGHFDNMYSRLERSLTFTSQKMN